MNLPKWVDDIEPCDNRPCSKNTSHLRGALAIAMEALESIDKHQALVASSMSKYSVTRHLADEALNRIRSLGGEE